MRDFVDQFMNSNLLVNMSQVLTAYVLKPSKRIHCVALKIIQFYAQKGCITGRIV